MAAACYQAQPAPVVDSAPLQILPIPGADAPVEGLSGHLSGVPVPQAGTASTATYSPTTTKLVIQKVHCGPSLDAAYAAQPATLARSCVDGVLTLEASGEARADWNPWSVDDWRIGPLTALPEIDAGPTFKPHRIDLDALSTIAHLTPKNPGRFVDLMGAALGDQGWVVRPDPSGGYTFHKGELVASIHQDGAQITVSLTNSP